MIALKSLSLAYWALEPACGSPVAGKASKNTLENILEWENQLPSMLEQ